MEDVGEEAKGIPWGKTAIYGGAEKSRERGKRNGTSAEYGMTTLFSSLFPSFLFFILVS